MNIHRTIRLPFAMIALMLLNADFAAATDIPAATTPPANESLAATAPAATSVPSAPANESQQNQDATQDKASLPSAKPDPSAVPAPDPQVGLIQGSAPPPAASPTASPAGANTPAPVTDSHEAPIAVQVQGENATPKEQAAVVSQSPVPGKPSGFRLMTLSTNALLSRVSLEDQATHSIDLQYYVFNNDATGRLIALHLLQAADRGVHVRMLIDDLNVADDALMFKALDAHPNIEVRLFNPFHSATATGLSKMAQFLLEFRRLNRRMHNKNFIVDNQVAIIGGRNIGDGYFDARPGNNFRDLDVIAIGPVVPAATAVFESYWNSDASHPMADYRSASDEGAVSAQTLPKSPPPGGTASSAADAAEAAPEPPPKDLAATKMQTGPAKAAKGSETPSSSGDPATERAILEKSARTFEQSAYQAAAADDLPNGASADRPGNWFWGNATVVADDPAKIEGAADPNLRISPELKALINGAHTEVLLISPYFIPSAQDEANFIALAQRGVTVKVLTNSLASTDELPVHEGYAGHRRALLKGGVQLFELQPAPGVVMAASDLGRSSGVSLHAKSFVVDRRYVFIGSLNMDQRSKLLNTEMGVVVDSPQLAKAIAGFFDTATLPANAYHVVLGARDGSHPSEMHWEATRNGKEMDYDHEPDTSLVKRVKVELMKLLPIDGLL